MFNGDIRVKPIPRYAKNWVGELCGMSNIGLRLVLALMSDILLTLAVRALLIDLSMVNIGRALGWSICLVAWAGGAFFRYKAHVSSTSVEPSDGTNQPSWHNPA